MRFGMTSLLLVLALAGCTTPFGNAVDLIPNDRFLEVVYDKDGHVIPGRSSIADGYLREIEQDLEYCHKQPAAGQPTVTPASFGPDNFKCTVRGSAYVMSGKIESAVRQDGCTMIRQELEANGLTLRYGSRWVLIPFPLGRGHTPFAYRWGSAVATVGGHEVPVAKGEN
jgi:hypothetical protein